MSVYGVETSATDKVRPGVLVSGLTVVQEAAYRWFITTPGTLLEDPNWGGDVEQYLSTEMTPQNAARIPSELRAGLLNADDRIDTCQVSSMLTGTGASLTLDILFECTCGDGPFDLSVRVTRENVDVIIGRRGAA